jgi:hypothetical protein
MSLSKNEELRQGENHFASHGTQIPKIRPFKILTFDKYLIEFYMALIHLKRGGSTLHGR